MNLKTAIRLAIDEAVACKTRVAVIELIAPERGEMKFWPCRLAWYEALAEDDPIWDRGPFLHGIATTFGEFHTEW